MVVRPHFFVRARFREDVGDGMGVAINMGRYGSVLCRVYLFLCKLYFTFGRNDGGSVSALPMSYSIKRRYVMKKEWLFPHACQKIGMVLSVLFGLGCLL